MSTVRQRRTNAIATGSIIVASTVAMDPGGWYPFGTAKWDAVLAAIAIAAWVSVAQGTNSPRDLLATSPRSIPRWVVAAWSALLAVLAVAAMFGREPLYAWIGTPERRLGWLTWVLFGLCLWLGTRVSSMPDRRVLARIVSIGALFVGVYSLIELIFGAPVVVETVGRRIGGPYGSSAFCGAALCVLTPVSVGVAIDRAETAWWRILGTAASVLGLVALVGTGTRAAVVGLGAAALVVAVARVGRWRRPSRGRAILVAAAAILVVTVGVVAASRSDSNLERNARRVVDVTASSRLDEWAVGVRIVAAHPILGVGPEGYRTALADGITADYERTYGRDVIPDRAHNGIIDVAAAGGVLAGLLYAAVLAFALVAAWRRLRVTDQVNRRSDPALQGFAAALIAYITQQVFLFPVSVLDPILWLFVGVVAGAAGSAKSTPPAKRTQPTTHLEPSGATRSWAVRAIGGAAILVIGVSTVLDISADRLAARAVKESVDEPDRPGESPPLVAARAARLRPDVVRYFMLTDRLQPMSISGIRTGLANLDSAARVSPLDPVVRRRHAERLLDLAIATGDDADRTTAVQAWADLAVDENCYRCHLGLGYAAALDGDTERSIAAFERAAQLARAGDPEAADAADAVRATRGPTP